MDYLNIILKGYADPNDREFFAEYILEQYKDSGQSRKRFFNGLIKAVKVLHEEIKQQWKDEIGKSILEDASISLFTLTNGKFSGHLWASQIYHISNEINKALKIIDEAREKISKQGQQPQQPEQNKKPQNEIESLIHQHFENMHEKGWAYAFITKEDYNYFVDLLSKDLHNEEYKLPSTEITLKRGTKTGIGRVLGELHKYKGEKLRTDKNFFNLIRILEPFKDESNQRLEKILTR